MSDERLARLEQRLEVLERLVRQLTEERSSFRVPPPVTEGGQEAANRSAFRVPRSESQPGEPDLAAAVSSFGAGPAVPPPTPAPSTGPRGTRNAERGTAVPRTFISEEWLGTRGLLAVGVIFLVLAAGYLLKLSFERGWVSPLVRCITGAISGAGIGLLGWRLHGKGYRTYGASLIGAGGAITYLAAWAAGRLYQFLPVTPAIASLALISLAVAGVAWAINVEALASAAALGAFFAPIVIGKEAGSVNLLLLYLGAMGLGLGTVGALKRWRVTTFIVALAYFGIVGTGVLSRAHPAGLYLYAILGGAAGLYLGLKEGWIETRFLAFFGGWGVLTVANNEAESHWATLLGGIVLAAPVWWRALQGDAALPDRSAEGRIRFGETFYFYLTPIFLGWALDTALPHDLTRNEGLVPLLVAIPYLAAGVSATRRPFALVACLALLTASFLQWSDLRAVWACFLIAPAWAALDHRANRTDGRWYAIVTFGVGLFQLAYLEDRRPWEEASFTGEWALTLWWSVATLAWFAGGLVRRTTGEWTRRIPPALWSWAGLVLLLGVTEELLRTFTGQRLAAGLSVSAWWILFAAGCFVLGFLRSQQALRYAGFAVAGLALTKVLLVDLSTLDAFYRIGSVLILGLVSLGVAYTYHRRARRARGGSAA